MPTMANLNLWGKVLSANCGLCGTERQTIHHVLNNCRKALHRYQWRHNVLLLMIKNFIDEHLQCDDEELIIVSCDVVVLNRKMDFDAVIHTVPPDVQYIPLVRDPI